MKQLNIFLISFLTLFTLIGCSNKEEGSNHDEADHEHTQIGDLREKTASVNDLPSFLDGKPEMMVTIYSAAAQHPDLLQNMPCYCGCADSVGHRDNFDCFVHDLRSDGSIVWDDHGTRCGVCLDIAAESIVKLSEGMSMKEIRTFIDEKYADGYPEPTPTPEVQA